eukprot:scaffold25653_cov28-Tisochrysis_lutea.AAC.2
MGRGERLPCAGGEGPGMRMLCPGEKELGGVGKRAGRESVTRPSSADGAGCGGGVRRPRLLNLNPPAPPHI